jgi:hypothetical protein
MPVLSFFLIYYEVDYKGSSLATKRTRFLLVSYSPSLSSYCLGDDFIYLFIFGFSVQHHSILPNSKIQFDISTLVLVFFQKNNLKAFARIWLAESTKILISKTTAILSPISKNLT